jgi:lactoylglutathione lyase
MTRINHLALKVSDLEEATRFYENVFGFRQVRTGRSRGHVSRHLTDGYVDLALMVYDSEDDQEAKLVREGPAIHHFGIEIDDRQDFIDKIEVNGGTLRSSPDSGAVKFRAKHRRLTGLARGAPSHREPSASLPRSWPARKRNPRRPPVRARLAPQQ